MKTPEEMAREYVHGLFKHVDPEVEVERAIPYLAFKNGYAAGYAAGTEQNLRLREALEVISVSREFEPEGTATQGWEIAAQFARNALAAAKDQHA